MNKPHERDDAAPGAARDAADDATRDANPDVAHPAPKPTEVSEQPLVAPDETGVGNDTESEVPNRDFDKVGIALKDARNIAIGSVCFIAIMAGLALAGYLLRFLWVGLLPVILAVLVSTVLFPVALKLRTWKFPAALAALTVIVGFFAIVGGLFTLMAPTVAEQSKTLATQAESGVQEALRLLEESPLAIDAQQLETALNDSIEFLKGQMSNIATGVLSGVSIASSILVAVLIMLVITFFILKDGDRFLPWMRKYTGSPVGWHATELFTRIWRTLAGFIQAQAAVALVDAVLIGLGLVLLGVPLAFVIAVVTFFASFIPIIGAVTAGALAVVIALVSNGVTNALLALLLIILVQQIEGNVLQPMLQSKAMGLHAAIVLLAVAIGSGLAGIIGAFLAVPAVATLAVILRYHAEMTSLRAGEIGVEDITIETGRGDIKHDKDPAHAIPTAVSPRQKVYELYQTMGPTESFRA